MMTQALKTFSNARGPWEHPVSMFDGYIIQREGLWWKAQVTHRNGTERDGDYGVTVTAKNASGELVAYEVGAHIFPRLDRRTPAALQAEADRVMLAAEAAAMRRVSEGVRVRVPGYVRGPNQTLHPKPVIEERGRVTGPAVRRMPPMQQQGGNVVRPAFGYGGGFGGGFGGGYGGRSTFSKPKPKTLDGSVSGAVKDEVSKIKREALETEQKRDD